MNKIVIIFHTDVQIPVAKTYKETTAVEQNLLI